MTPGFDKRQDIDLEAPGYSSWGSFSELILETKLSESKACSPEGVGPSSEELPYSLRLMIPNPCLPWIDQMALDDEIILQSAAFTSLHFGGEVGGGGVAVHPRKFNLPLRSTWANCAYLGDVQGSIGPLLRPPIAFALPRKLASSSQVHNPQPPWVGPPPKEDRGYFSLWGHFFFALTFLLSGIGFSIAAHCHHA